MLLRSLFLSSVLASSLALAAGPAAAQVGGSIQLGPVQINVGSYDPGYNNYNWGFNDGTYYAPGWYQQHYWEGGVWRGSDYYRQHGQRGYRYRQAHVHPDYQGYNGHISGRQPVYQGNRNNPGYQGNRYNHQGMSPSNSQGVNRGGNFNHAPVNGANRGNNVQHQGEREHRDH